jgi:hypothetical protein
MSLADQAVLGGDTTFISRVRSASIAGAIVISNEALSVANHFRRANFAAQVINAPDTFKAAFTSAIATDTTVINAATSNGTIILDGSNVAARAAVVTDAQINTAMAAVYQAFFNPV